MGLPRYLATAAVDDLERTLWIADDLFDQPAPRRSVAMVQCGQSSPLATELSGLLKRSGRDPVDLVIYEREQAQAPSTLRKLAGVSAVWVFADNLFAAFMSVFATQLAFALRTAARQGLPVVGVGTGAMSLGGLLVAQRVCDRANYELVSGLGWAQRVLIDGGANRGLADVGMGRDAVCSLPGLLGVDIGVRGGVKVFGGQVQSVGDEPIVLFGANDAGGLLTLRLEPGRIATIAPPPFAPFTSALLPPYVTNALKPELRPLAPPPRQAPLPAATAADAPQGKLCPMCNKVHHPVAVAA
jgi:hypothetical protein